MAAPPTHRDTDAAFILRLPFMCVWEEISLCQQFCVTWERDEGAGGGSGDALRPPRLAQTGQRTDPSVIHTSKREKNKCPMSKIILSMFRLGLRSCLESSFPSRAAREAFRRRRKSKWAKNRPGAIKRKKRGGSQKGNFFL